ncbi:MAG TPA: molybdopterin cofactor-binding domain-containing protein, partial [Paracoccaceae bacterium]|nr:molybdopterin cofactor-binding domain-containing protein [Paracoccaceae bacterium]
AIIRSVEKIATKAKKIAAHLMEAWETDIELKNGQFPVVDTGKFFPWADICLAAYMSYDFPHESLEPGLEERAG